MQSIAEAKFKSLLAIDQANHEGWNKYALYNLRRRKFELAEEAYVMALNYCPGNVEYLTTVACLLLRRNRVAEGEQILKAILKNDKTSILQNSLMAFKYYKITNEPKWGKKYFAVSQKARMRFLNILPTKGKQTGSSVNIQK